MFNVLLDPLPEDYEGYPIDADFQIGIQIMQAFEDEELSEQERMMVAISLLFLGCDKEYEEEDEKSIPFPDSYQTAAEGVLWFLKEWNHDKESNDNGKDKVRVLDFDIDQWRIYSGFRQHYNINLNTDKLHYWEFMGLLTTFPDCAFTKVIDIRAKEITNKMSAEERSAYKKLKERYALKQRTVMYTDEEIQAIDEYDRMMMEQKKKKEQQLAIEAFEEMNKNVK